MSIQRTFIKFATGAWMHHRIYQACVATGTVSNTVYIQHAVCEALSRDLGIPLAELIEGLPPPRSQATNLRNHVPRIGSANTVEEVR